MEKAFPEQKLQAFKFFIKTIDLHENEAGLYKYIFKRALTMNINGSKNQTNKDIELKFSGVLHKTLSNMIKSILSTFKNFYKIT